MIEDGVARHFYADLDEALGAVQAWHDKLFDRESKDVRVSEKKPQLRIVK
jgi:hypothetical protein